MCFPQTGSRICVIRPRPVGVELQEPDEWNSKGIYIYIPDARSNVCVIILCKDRICGGKLGLWLFSSPIITETNNSKSSHHHPICWLTSISLLEGTHLYETFAVWGSYCSAFATASLVCVSQVSDPLHPPPHPLLIVSFMAVFSSSPRWTMQFYPRFTWNIQNMMSLQVASRLN